ncbi:16S rRNA (adenine(1518)-N(6)/adenine(1519)-N(6))-dimethyltransferase RsmA [Olivibacter domesticus]|uniref:Ribosomal RNA small subunit methyltransferase A n=1 Tax=Olivibacter domesticus TaxID=407022 RepID=A0A1H7ZNY8_OLID1|nr:16S rRNA (adenine(1518)-N(6)/adenine(1519)-N(6))-dimethyltransferase RsmA [Olivibacter domesticus]SEM60075.1 16S rRNA (adenine1518-N6/adenine1519-N6)-dimethyltransferase [Olivibacter domesticus]
MGSVRAKKHLGQHFLTDKNIATKIVGALQPDKGFNRVLEVGPGMGVLSDILLENNIYDTWLIDIDGESIEYLKDRYPSLQDHLIHGDFLTLNINDWFKGPLAIIGNFPYNISSQILFKVLEHRNQVVEVVGMFQKEVAERCTASPGNKDYGILSVFLQAYYDVRYLFTVKAGAFNPPPKVLSGVIRLERNNILHLACNELLFWKVVKAGFNQRRKTLRNALSVIVDKNRLNGNAMLDLRAERLSVENFVELTNFIEGLAK